ncbi:Zinc finger MYM-type protein 1-like [Oopsacas minuta]|uniref:Zinc finger MYM-type protein 1-like n=1 Tax=Oopsacas minuta TaxID=111878 RepID=A0AAV7K121_9METZ|nr:Zinc finger MYM-type protein 1-like [Oopsacas minuta]
MLSKIWMCVPKLSRRRKLPKRYDDGAPVDFPDDFQTHYRQSYFESLDLVIKAIEDRLNQPDYDLYRRLEELLIHTILGDSTQEYFDFVANFYLDDFDTSQLRLHLEIFRATFLDSLSLQHCPVTISGNTSRSYQRQRVP